MKLYLIVDTLGFPNDLMMLSIFSCIYFLMFKNILMIVSVIGQM